MLFIMSLILTASNDVKGTPIVDNVPIVELIKLQNGPWVTKYYVFWDFSRTRCMVDVKHPRDIKYVYVDKNKMGFLDTASKCRRIVYFNTYIETHTVIDVDRVEKYLGWTIPRVELTPRHPPKHLPPD